VQHSNLLASDDAKRIADAVTLHAIAGNVGRWAAFRMDDGRERHRHVTFGSRIEAVKACGWDRDETVYIEIQPGGMEPKEAQAFLGYARFLHSQGWRLPDPEFDFDGGMPAFSWDQAAMARQLVGGKPA
jgi:hypothetical protein